MPYALKPITYIMQANLVLSMSDPVTVFPSNLSLVELCRKVFENENPEKRLLKVLENAPPQKGCFNATVWISDFAIDPSQLMSVFLNSAITHNGKSFKARCPTVQEYMEFQNLHFVNDLLGNTVWQEEVFFYDNEEHAPFNLTSKEWKHKHFPVSGLRSLHVIRDAKTEVTDWCLCYKFLLILEDF